MNTQGSVDNSTFDVPRLVRGLQKYLHQALNPWIPRTSRGTSGVGTNCQHALNWSELSFDDIGEWPSVLKYVSAVVPMLFLIGLGYWLVIEPNAREYKIKLSQERSLRKQLEGQQQEAAHLHAYRHQLRTLQYRFGEVRKQLSKRSEMPGLLADISKTGITSGLTFELFAPQSEMAHDFYIELPINVIVVGNYHQFAVFLSRIAQMSRIVTPHDFEITPYVVDPKSADSIKEPKLLENQAGLLIMTLVVNVYWVRGGDSFAKESMS